MRVFVTGASGFVGSAVVQELLGAGHEVVGLARSDAGLEAVRKAGATPLRGDVVDLDSLRRGAREADGVIHCAFNHDFSKFLENCENDRRAIGALAEAVGTDRRLLVTSGTVFAKPGVLATEHSGRAVTSKEFPRVASEEAAEAAAERGVNAGVVRLPPTVHADGIGGFATYLVAIAREKGVSAYIGEGSNRWPAAHRLDAARGYRLALEKGLKGAKYHLVGEQELLTRDIAAAIGAGLNLPVASITTQEAPAHFGFLSAYFAIDCPCSSAWTQATLGWTPTNLGLLQDLSGGIPPP